MAGKDELLKLAEQLASGLPKRCHNELKKLQRYYSRRGNLALLDAWRPRRGGGEIERWQAIANALHSRDPQWRKAGYKKEEVDYILGWAARLVNREREEGAAAPADRRRTGSRRF